MDNTKTIAIPKTNRIIPAELQNSMGSFHAKFDHQMHHSPSMEFIENSDLLIIRGRSTSFFTSATFAELLQMVESHLNQKDQLIFRLEFDMANTATIKSLCGLVTLLNKFAAIGKRIKLEWAVDDDEDIQETAECLQSYADFLFVIT